MLSFKQKAFRFFFIFSFSFFLSFDLQARGGDLDPSFGNAGMVKNVLRQDTSEIRAITLQRDGKIWAVGSALTGRNKDIMILRLNGNGSLDNTFNPLPADAPGEDARTHNSRIRIYNGKLFLDVAGADFDEVANAIVLQSDGKILVAGKGVQYLDPQLRQNFHTVPSETSILVRLNPNATLDASFDNDNTDEEAGGKIIGALGSSIESIILGENHIIVGGYYKERNAENSSMSLAGLRMDGSWDSRGFLFGGLGRRQVGSSSEIKTLLLQSTGRIVGVGNATFDRRKDVVLVRFESNGLFVNNNPEAFGAENLIRVDVNGNNQNDEVFAAIQQGDGKILVAGTTGSYDSKNSFVLRFLPDGSVDESFGDHGKVIFSISPEGDEANAIAVDANGNIFVAGTADHNIYVVAMRSSGAFDASFGAQGKKTIDLGGSDFAHTIALQTDGKIVIAGKSNDAAALVRLEALSGDENEHRDQVQATPAFNRDQADTTVRPKNEGQSLLSQVGTYLQGVLLPRGEQSSDSVTVNLRNPQDPNASVKLKENSSGFNRPGHLPPGWASGSADHSEEANPPNPPAALPPSPWLDAGFNGNPPPLGNLTGRIYAKAFTIQGDDKILMGGTYRIDRMVNCLIVRFLATGGLDSNFGQNGYSIHQLGRGDCSGHALIPQADGKVILVGTSYNGVYEQSPADAVVIRVTAQGQADPSFGLSQNGVVLFPIGDRSSQGMTGALQADGKILVGAWATKENRTALAVLRLNSDGSLDPSFGELGRVLLPFAEKNARLRKISVQPDGKILLLGDLFHFLGNADQFVLARLMPNGSLDRQGFVGKGMLLSDGGIELASLNDMALLENGDILVLGNQRLNNHDSFDLMNFQSNGRVASEFGPQDLGFVASVHAKPTLMGEFLAVQKNGPKILVAGMTQGQRSISVVRLNADGIPDDFFGEQGEVRFDLSGQNELSSLVGMGVQNDGKIVLADSNFRLARILPGDSQDRASDQNSPPREVKPVGDESQVKASGDEIRSVSSQTSSDVVSSRDSTTPMAQSDPQTGDNNSENVSGDHASPQEASSASSTSSCSLGGQGTGMSEKYLFFLWGVGIIGMLFRRRQCKG